MRTLCNVVIIVMAVAAISCGGSPTQPGGMLTVSSITPSNGTTLGGTPITITGSNFSAGATVTVGGVAATQVVVNGSALLTAVTAQRAAGPADVVVTSGGNTGRLGAAFTYVAPGATTNTPPVIVSLSAHGTRPNEPTQFADLDEPIEVSAVVTDTEPGEAPPTYEWSSNAGGLFTGTGPSVTWRAPASPPIIPITASLTLTVVERYASVDDSGLPVTRENRVTGSISVSVHDSRKEVGDLARQFLLDFSDSNIQDVNYILRNFTEVGFCADERAKEFDQVSTNRREKRITSFRVDQPNVIVNFGGLCNYLASPARWDHGDACALVPVEWHDVSLFGGPPSHTRGTDQVPAVYLADQSRWALCGSSYEPIDLVTGLPILSPGGNALARHKPNDN